MAMMVEAVKGFEATGICSMNHFIFEDKDIFTADLMIQEASRQVSQSGIENEFIEPVIAHDETIHSLPSSPTILHQPNVITSPTPQ
ncbi:hypothetical protein HHI36_004004 [Cryptolaemus montrouzieri]|uniref:Uncharacterized protein n=1 Tax=Cryptolaemus montrouzieri TaxID=559131 RepID=A0ABD2NQH8_9CUCU